MDVDIYIREKSGSREIRIPILPEECSFLSGDATFVTHDIMSRGEVSVPSGTELGTYSWGSEFPGEQQKNDSRIRGTWKDPKTYKNLLEEWKSNGTKLNLLIIGYPVNVDVYCQEFLPKGIGPFGGISYEVQFLEARSITITTSKQTVTTKRPTTTAIKHVVKKGDCPWYLAELYYGDGKKWPIIYNANLDLIKNPAHVVLGGYLPDCPPWVPIGSTITIPEI
ncbi:MAG: LysM peptidoglycan-binding domain-containing protein [Faecousia sp.]